MSSGRLTSDLTYAPLGEHTANELAAVATWLIDTFTARWRYTRNEATPSFLESLEQSNIYP